MKVVVNLESIHKKISDIKKSAGEHFTNFYPNDEKLSFWIKKGILYTQNEKDMVFYFRKDRDFFHLYFYSKNKIALEQGLEDINDELSDILVADCIGIESDTKVLVEIFERCGFHKYIMYRRMKKFIPVNERLPEFSQEVSLADIEDAPIICLMFENNFDRFAEQLPTTEELKIAISNKEIIVIKDNLKIAGVLIRKMTPKSSLLMFFLVNKEYRNKKIGSKLLSYFFNECRGKRITMMVLANNKNAIDIYKHYGFIFNSLNDQIMINKNVSYEAKSN